jgi:hypothetical protein
VHFRRGDYCFAGVTLTADYYKAAIDIFPKNYTFVVFSDDINYCKGVAQDFFGERDVIFMEGQSPGIDMCVMSLCDHNITANSTFSLWSAALNTNKNKIVVSVPTTPGGDSISSCFPDWKIIQ